MTAEASFNEYCLELLGRLKSEDKTSFVEHKTSREHLSWMLEEIISSDMPWGKKCRWLGYVQGVMASKFILVVDEERDRTREFLTALDKENCKSGT